MNETYYLLYVDDFDHVQKLHKGGEWVEAGVTFPIHGPCYILWSPLWPPIVGTFVSGRDVLFRAINGAIETWHPLMKEWLLCGLHADEKAKDHWVVIRERRILITEAGTGESPEPEPLEV